MISIAIRVSVVLLLTAGVGFGLRRSSAAIRSLVWSIGLTFTLLLPLLRASLPDWEVFPPTSVAPSTMIATGTALRSVIPGARTDEPARPGGALVMIWAFGALIMLARFVAAEVALLRWKQQAQPAQSPAWRAAIERISGSLPQTRAVTFLESDQLDTPCTWGILQPIVLLPCDDAERPTQWTAHRRDCALLHELAHVRRFDSATKLVGRLVAVLHWYNPLVWKVTREALAAQEQACDDAVLVGRVAATEYATLLMQFASGKMTPHPASAGALGFARSTGTEARVRSLLDVRRKRDSVSRRSAVFGTAIGTALLIAVATAAPAQKSNSPHLRPDSATMAKMAKQLCDAAASRARGAGGGAAGGGATRGEAAGAGVADGGAASRDSANLVANFTVRGQLNSGTDTTPARIVEFSVALRCGQPPN